MIDIIYKAINASKTLNRRALNTLNTALVLSIVLSACSGGGGGGGGSSAPAPVSTISFINNPLIFNEDFAGATTVSTVVNVDGGTLTFTITESTTGVVDVSTSTTAVLVSSIPNANGRTTLTITANDGTISASTQVTVIVNSVNDPPTLSVSTNSISTVDGFSPITINTSANDVEDGVLALTVTESTTGVVRVSTSANAIVLRSISNTTGTTTLTLTAVDSSDTRVIQTISVSVTAKASFAPVLTVSTNLISVPEDFRSSVIILTTATDLDSDTITLTVRSSSRLVDVVLSTLSNGMSTLTLTAIDNANGTAILTVQATAGGQTISTEIVVVVSPVNDPPTLNLTTTALTLNEDFATTRLITVNRSDIENDTLTFSVTESTSAIVSVRTSSAGVQVASIANASGQTTLTITVSDGNSNASTHVVVTVNAVNDTPTLNVSTNSISTVGGFSPIPINTTASDIEDDHLTFTVTESSTGVIRVTTSTNAIVLNTIPGASGQTTLTVSAVDSSGTTVTQIISVNVTITDSFAPVLTVSTNLISVQEDFRNSVIIQTTATDADGDTIIVSVSQSIRLVDVVVSPPVSGKSTLTNDINMTALDNLNGTTTLTVLAADIGGQSITTEIVVVLTAVEDAPTLTIPTATLRVTEDFDEIIPIATAMDADDDPLLLSVVETTTGVVTVTTSASGVSVASKANEHGTATLTITVNDGKQDTTAQVVVIVTPVNDTPTLTISNATLTAVEDFTGAVTVATATDVDGNMLTVSVTEAPTGVVRVSTSTSDVRISSLADRHGVTTLIITVDDGELSSTAQVLVTVTPVNDPPALSVSTTLLTLNEDFATPVLIGTTRTDLDGDTLTLTVAETNTGVVTVTTSAFGVQITNIAEINGVTTLTITLSDGTTSTSTQVTVIVNPVNDPPDLIVSTTALTLNEDFATPVLIRTTRSDVDSNTLTLTVTESNTGVITVTTSSLGVSVSNIRNANGQTTLTMTLSDGNSSSTTQVTVTVASIDDPPTLTVSTTVLTLVEDFSTSILIRTTRSDVDSNTLTLTVTESNTGVITVTTSSLGVSVSNILNANGQTTLTMTLSDGISSSTTQVTVTVTPVNDPPSLTISTTALTLTEDFSVPVLIRTTRSDVDSNTLTFTLTESTVVTAATTATGVLISSILNANGQTTLTMTLSDGNSSSTTQVTVTVTPINDPPSLTISTTALTLTEDFETIVPIIVTGIDIENDTLTFSVAESSTGVVRVTTSTSDVQVEKIAHAHGQTTLTITVSDGNSNASTHVVVTVNAVNDTPTLNVSTNSISTVGGFSPITINTTASDIEDDHLTFTVTESSTGVVSVTTSTNAIVLNTIPGASGQTTLTVRVVDSSGTIVTQIISVNVTITDSVAPVLTVSTNLISVQEDFRNSVIIQTTATDADGDTITVSVSQSIRLVDVVVSPPVSGKSTLTNGINMTALDNLNGTTTLTVLAADVGGQSITTEIVVVLTAVEDAPTLTIPTATLRVTEDFDEIIPIATAMDADDDPLLLSVIETTTGVVTVTTSASGVSVASKANEHGTTTLTITVNDGKQDTTAQVVVIVTPVNDTPTLTISNATLTAVEDFTGAVTVATATDVDGNMLTVSVTEAPTGVVRVSTSTSDVRISSLADRHGVTTLIITVDDGELSSTAQVLVTVTPVNDPPALSVSTTLLTLNEDFATPVLIGTTRTDLDGDTLTITVAETNAGVVTVTTSAFGVQITSIAEINGVTTLTITLSDGTTSTSTQVTVIVNPVNDPPDLIVSTTALTLLEDFATPVLIRTTRSDVDSNTLTLTVTESNTGVITVTTSSLGVSVSNIRNANGQTNLTMTLSDGNSSSTTHVAVTITPVNDTPTLTIPTTQLVVFEDFETLTTIATAIDAEDDTLSFTVVETNTGVVNVTTSASGVFVSSIQNKNGQSTLTITVDDGTTQTSAQVAVLVTAVNDTPTLSISTNSLRLAEDFEDTLIIATAVNVDGDTLTISVIESSTGVVNVTTSASIVQISRFVNANGVTTLSISVSDELLSSTAQVTVTVLPVNDTPTVSLSTTALVLAEDFETIIPIIVTGIDIENDTLTFSVDESSTGVVRVTTSTSGVHVERIAHAHGQTTLTIVLSDRSRSSTAQVMVWVRSVNDTPTLSVSTNSITTAGGFSPITINTTASDIEDDRLTFTVTESSTGVVRVTTSTNAIVLNTISAASGQTTLTVSAVDRSGATVTQIITVNVTITDSVAPVLTVSTNLISIQEDFRDSVIIQTTATDVDGDTITVSVSPSIRLVKAVVSTPVDAMSTITNRISLTAIANLNGTATLTVLASDVAGQSTSTKIIVVVTAVEDTPTLTIPSTTLTVLEDFEDAITIATSVNVDGDTLTYTVIESSTMVVTVTTSASGVQIASIAHKNGFTTLTITVSDGARSSTARMTVMVSPVNDAPIITLSTANLVLAEEFSGIRTVAAAIDLEGDTLTLSVVESSTDLVTVTTSASGVFVSSIFNANGQTTLTLTVSDGSTSTSIQVAVTITPVNDTPSLTVSTTALTLMEDFSALVLIHTTRSDVDSNTLTLTVADSTVVTAVTTASGVLISSILHANGQTTLIITVSDGASSSTTEVSVVVTPIDDPPTLTVSTTALTLFEDFATPVLIVTTRSDVDGDTLTLTVSESSAGIVTATTTATGVLISSILNANGQTTLTISVSDGNSSSTTQVVVIVTPLNDPPSLTVSTTALSLAEDFAGFNAVATAVNVDGDTLTLSVDESTTGVVNVTTSATSVFVSRILNANGQTTLTITVSDKTLSSTAHVVVMIAPVNDTPTLTIPATQLVVLEDFESITTIATAIDQEEDALTFTVVESTTGVVNVTTSATGVFVSSIHHATGQTTLTITVSDKLLNSTAQMMISVLPINDRPTISIPMDNIILAEDFAITTVATAIDVDGDTLTYSVVNSTTALVTVTTSASGVFVSSKLNAYGQATLTITVSDDLLISTGQVVVTVTPVNDTPTITITRANFILNEDFAVITTVATAIDVEGDTLTLNIVGSFPGLVNVSTSATDVFVSSVANFNGQTILTITVSDHSLTSTAQAVVTVIPINDPPTITLPTTTLIVTEDFGGVKLVASSFDPDGNAVNISVIESTTGVVKVSTTVVDAFISRIPHANGDTTLTINVFDGTTITSTQVAVTVTSVNDPPTLTISTTDLTFIEDFSNSVLIATTRTDVEGDTLTISVAESRMGLVAITTSAKGVLISSKAHVHGVTTLTISLSDGKLSSTAQVAVTVISVNDTPTLNVSIIALTLREDFITTALIRVTTADFDGDKLTLTVTDSNTGVVTVTTSVTGVSVSSILNAHGQTTLTFTLSDGTTSTTTQVPVTVTPVNDPPSLSASTTLLTINEDFATAISIALTSRDIENNTLTLSVNESTTGIVRLTTSITSVSVSSILNANGQTNLTISLSDGSTQTSTHVAVIVNAVNDTPTFSTVLSRLNFNEDFADVSTVVTASDIDGDTLIYRVTETSTGVITVTTSDAGVRLSNKADANGRTTLTITASDALLDISTQVVVTVNAINDTPTLSVSTNNISTFGGFAPITIDTTATDVEDGVLSYSVQASNSAVFSVTTSTNAIVLNSNPNVSGRTTLTVSVVDSLGIAVTQTITVNVTINPSVAPVLTVSTNLIHVDEDFMTPVVIQSTATDSDSRFVSVFVQSTINLINAAVSAQVNNRLTITLSPIAHLNGTATLTVVATDAGGVSVSEQIVVVINPVLDPISFAFSTPVVTLTTPGKQMDRNTQIININNSGNEILRAQLQLTSSGSAIFSANPVPVVSFSTNALATVTTLTSIASTAQLYFSIQPNRIGTATLTVQLTNLTTSEMSEQTIKVQVNPIDVPPAITQIDPQIQDLIVYGGHLYANSVPTTQAVTPFLATANALGGHLININTVEELNFLNSTANALTVQNPWLGLVLPQMFFPGELFWVTNDSTIAYGYASTNSSANAPTLPTVYPGHFSLNWHSTNGLVASRSSSRFADFNWTIYSGSENYFYLLGNGGEGLVRPALFEFPQGLAPTSIKTIPLSSGSSTTVRLTGFDLNGDAINTVNWSGVAPNGGTISFNNVSQSSGVQTVDMVYTAPISHGGLTTVVVTLQVNGLNTTMTVPFFVNAPTFTLASNAIVLFENSSQTIRNQQLISHIGIQSFVGTTHSNDVQLSVTHSGDAIFSANPVPEVSFSTNASVTRGRIDSTMQSAQLYFSIAPDQIGTGTLTVQLTDLTRSEKFQQTLVVQVNPMVDVPPEIVPLNPAIRNLIVEGGRLYANSLIATQTINMFLPSIDKLGGHLVNFNTVEEFTFVHSTASGLVSHLSWLGLTLPQLTFPGELAWITNDSTIGYGYVSDNGANNLRIYPGHYALNWESSDGLFANRGSSRPSVNNWTVYSRNIDKYFLLGDKGDQTSRYALYEFPKGLTKTSVLSETPIPARIRATVFQILSGFDLNGDAMNVGNWSGVDLSGGIVNFNHLAQRPGVHTVNLVYFPPPTHDGQTTVVVTLQTNGLSTTAALTFIVDGPPNIALSSQNITLAEDFNSYVIGTTVTERGVDGILPFTVLASVSGIVNITPSANAIRLSSIQNVSGKVTLTVRAADSAFDVARKIVVITVNPVSDTPTITVSTNNISVLGAFTPITIAATATDIEDGSLALHSVQTSRPGVVSVQTLDNAIVLSPSKTGWGRTTLTILAVDNENTTGYQTIAVNVIVTPSATPVLTVSTNLISLQEDFTDVFIGTTATDNDADVLVVTVSTSSNLVKFVHTTQGITLSSIAHLFGTTTLTIQALDPGRLFDSTEIVIIVNSVNDTPTLTVSTTAVSLIEDFTTSVIIRTTATDVEGPVTLSVTTGIVNAVLSSQTNGVSIITLTAIDQLNGTSTLTVKAIDSDGTSVSKQIVVAVKAVNDPISFSFANPVVTLTGLGNPINRNVQNINISNPGNESVRTQLQLTRSGDPIFSVDPVPVVSFSTTALTTETTLTSTAPIAQLYFSIIPNQTGTSTLTVNLSNLTTSEVTQQTMVVQVTQMNVPPMVVQTSSKINNRIVHGGRLYANSVMTAAKIEAFLMEVKSLGGHLVNFNTAEEFTFVRSTASGLITQNAWIGLKLPKLEFPGELSWITNESTVAFGFSSRDGINNLNVYPGHYALNWQSDSGSGFYANRGSSRPSVFNWAVYTRSIDKYFLLGDGGDTSPRPAVYEFPQGIIPDLNLQVAVGVNSSATVRLTGFDLNGDAINTANWSGMDPRGGTANFSNVTQSSGVQIVDMVYTAPSGFIGRTTLTVTLQVNGLSTTTDLSIFVGMPTFALRSTTIVLTENSSQSLRNYQQIINVRQPPAVGNTTTDLQLRLTHSGDAIFSSNPVPVISLSTNAIVTLESVDSAVRTAHLYFTIAPDRTGTATLTIQLTNLATSEMSQQTMVVQVMPMGDVPPKIAPLNANIQNLIVRSGRLYANSVSTTRAITSFLADASTLGGHLININTIEEWNFVQSAASGLISQHAWFGLVLPKLTFPGELFWVTNDSTTAYGYGSNDGKVNFSVYPGHFVLEWDMSAGLYANRQSSRPSEINWTVYTKLIDKFFLLGNGGDTTDRNGLYEFPQGLAQPSIQPIPITAGDLSGASIRLAGFDLNGDAITTSSWTTTSTIGTVSLNTVSQRSGAQMMDLHYRAPTGFSGPTTVAVTLQVNGLSSTLAVPFIVTTPTFTLDSFSIVLTENSSQTIRHQHNIRNIEVPVGAIDMQWRLTHSGDAIFSSNPTPVISFSTTEIVTTSRIGTTAQSAQLYFSVAPDRTGRATLTLQLINLNTSEISQQSIVVQVNPMKEVPPQIARVSTNFQNFIVQSGRLYANSVTAVPPVTSFLVDAMALGGHLININTIEEINFVRSAASGLISQEAWFGMVLPKRNFPGELSWVTNDSTIAYGYATQNGVSKLTVYPGHFVLDFPKVGGLDANRSLRTSTVFNWTIYSRNSDIYFLIDDGGFGTSRHALYEFPLGLVQPSIQPIPVTAGDLSGETIRLVGFDLNGDAITTSDWTATAMIGTVNLNNISQNTGVQMMDMVYTAPSDFRGQTTILVTIQANGLSTTKMVPILVTTPAFTLASNSIVLTENSAQTIRHQQTFTNVGLSLTTGTTDAQWRVMYSGDAIFSSNPTPVVSFSTNAISTTGRIGTTTQTAQLYFSIAPDTTGTATLTLQLINLTTSEKSQQSIVVQVNPMNDFPPGIALTSPKIQNLIVQSGRLYANSASSTTQSVSTFLKTARDLGGHLININTIEEINFVRTTASGLVSQEAWFGMVLPRRNFAGELSWVTNDSTIAYGYSRQNGVSNLTVYPGHFDLEFPKVGGLDANRTGQPSTVFNWTIYSRNSNIYFLLDDGGNGTARHAIYEFPQGLAPPSNPVPVFTGSNVTVRLTGFDLNGDAIKTSDWSAVAVTGSVVSFSHVSQSTGLQTVDMVYSAPANFRSQTTVVVTLQVNGLKTTAAVSFVPGQPTFTLPSNRVVIYENSSQTIRNQQTISNVKIAGYPTTANSLGAQWRVTYSGDTIFSSNPTPIVSYSTNAEVTTASIGSVGRTAQLYFTVAPDRTGTATLTLQLENSEYAIMSQQTMVVQVNPMKDVAPQIAPYSPGITIHGYIVHGGRLYANTGASAGVDYFEQNVRALGGHVININTVEEFNFMTAPENGLYTVNIWVGLILPRTAFPGQLHWGTNDGIIPYGYASANGLANLTVYPGHYNLNWNSTNGLIANRPKTVTHYVPPTVANWAAYNNVADEYLLIPNTGHAAVPYTTIFEFPQGITAAFERRADTRANLYQSISLTGYDLNGDDINLSDWSATDLAGGRIFIYHSARSTGLQSVSMLYDPPTTFSGETTVTVTLQVNGLSTTKAISIVVDGPPNITLSTYAITLAEDFKPYDIGITITDEIPIPLPYSVETSTTGIVTVTTSASTIRLSALSNVNGKVTLTVKASDRYGQLSTAQIVVSVQAVNDPPTFSVSTKNISTLGGFSPITIGTTATDIEDGILPIYSVQASVPGVVSVTTAVNAIVMSPIAGGSSQTILTVRAIDSENATAVQTIAVNVMVTLSATPVLTVSTNLIRVQEDFSTTIFIRTTATDEVPNSLVVSFSSSTHIVNAVLSTQGITLSSAANLYGTTTLTVRATDVGGLFASTEIVVIVHAVNDTPTITASTHTVSLGTEPISLTISASDIEDGVLSFSVSTGQNMINTAFTTTNLTITRSSMDVSQIVLTLRTTDSDSVTTLTTVTVALSPALFITTGIKTLNFAWNAINSATHYYLRSNPDGRSGFLDLSTTSIVVSPNSTNIAQTTAQGLVALHRYIPRVSDPRYGVGTCDVSSCGATLSHHTAGMNNSQLNSLIGRLQASNPDANDNFGERISLSGDGNTLAVGALREDGNSRGINGSQGNHILDTGAVYVFRRNGGRWSQQAFIKASNEAFLFGSALSLSADGNTLAVGTRFEHGASTGINGDQNAHISTFSGATYLFRFSGGKWSQQAYIKASNTGEGDDFGNVLSLSDDGNSLAVAAVTEDSSSTGVNGVLNDNSTDTGTVYLFRFNTISNTWSQQAHIKASNAGINDRFGSSLSMSGDGNMLAVGTTLEDGSSTGINGVQNNNSTDTGAVYVFRFNTTSNNWVQHAYIKASNADAGDLFGRSISLSADGNTLAVGADGEASLSTGVNSVPNNNSYFVGAVYIFRLKNDAWTQQAYIKSSVVQRQDRIGWSVSLSSDGNILAVGTSGERSSAMGIGGVDDNSNTNFGASYIFEFSNATWTQITYIKANRPGRTFFGQTVHLSNDGGALAMGDHFENGPAGQNQAGAVYLY